MSSAPQSPSTQPRSLYRRHRPRTFDDVVGQEPVVRTLRNAVLAEKVHHAYLFVGSRGTGKTSMAKILAACLNCERGAGITPCGVCESCISIAEARSLDVIEMDAASNNSVEDIRDLRDSVAFAPLSGRTKVYILDEAHMLSTAAWNAFLKTLEEPPPNTVFVLATTEAQKVPATVIDRCHRFDFQMPSVEQVSTVLRRAAQAESISIPPEAVAALARAAGGSFRDALGTLEQLLTYSGQEIALQDVLAVLGVTDGELIAATLDAVNAGDAKQTLTCVESCVSAGRDPGAFAGDLEARARELMVVQVLGEVPAELSLTQESDVRLAEQASHIAQGSIVRLLDLLAAATEAMRAGGDARTQLELALLKAARPEVDPSTKALLARIERLESGAPQAVASPPIAVPASRAASTAPEPPAAPEPPVVSNGAGPVEQAPATDLGEQTAQAPAPEQQMPAAQAPAVQPERPAPAATAVANATDPEAMRELWPAVVDLVRSSHALLGAVIEEATPVAVHEGELTLAFAPSSSFKKKKAEDSANRAAVSEAIASLTGQRLRIRYELRQELEQDGGAGGGDERAEEELFRRLIAEFDAEELPAEKAPSAAQDQQEE
ncbi:MAG TPA: DNA polymerase III subunit gamma/tau [Solirubrobacteraceae bacterium]|nr:DNA polymerase III subunit gamma/tau [Solirubrobacteraceae bacterium]